MTIYIDVLIILNIYVNYFLLKTTSKLTHTPLKTWRCLLASFYGSLYSLMILAPPIPVSVTIPIKLTAAISITILAFGLCSCSRILKNIIAFFTVNFIFGGFMYFIYAWIKPDSMRFANSFFYIDFSLLVLLITTALLYVLVCLIKRITIKNDYYNWRLIIRSGTRIINLDGLADTGNSLIDFFSGKPVIICNREDIGSIKAKIRLIPFSTISENGVIPVFKPDEVVAVNNATGEKKNVDVMIGLGTTNGKAIYNPKIIKY